MACPKLPPNGEGILQIPPPRQGIEAALRRRPAYSPNVADDRQVRRAAERLAQFDRLVKAASRIPPAMKRHGNECIRMLKREQKLGQEQVRERWHIIESMTELQRLQSGVDGKRIQQGGACASKRRRPELTDCTMNKRAGRHGLVAAPARMRNSWQVRAATETEVAERVAAAEHAAVRQDATDNRPGHFCQQTALAAAVPEHRHSMANRSGDCSRRKPPFRPVMARGGGRPVARDDRRAGR